jgi:hypothetical protein
MSIVNCIHFCSPDGTIRITKSCDGIGLSVNLGLSDIIPSGTTAQRPTSPVEGPDSLRYNTTEHTFEYYNGTEWGPLGGTIVTPEGDSLIVVVSGDTLVVVTSGDTLVVV